MNSITVCPECSGVRTFETIDTRYKNDTSGILFPYIVRRRKCKICGYRITTYEISQEDFYKMKKIDKMEKIQNALKDEKSQKKIADDISALVVNYLNDIE